MEEILKVNRSISANMKGKAKRQLTDSLESWASDWLDKKYGLGLTISIQINNRLKNSLGCIYSRTQMDGTVKSDHIEINGKHAFQCLLLNDKNALLNTLKHELTHYALQQLGKPYNDGTTVFENELIKNGAPTSGKIKYRKNHNKQVSYRIQDVYKDNEGKWHHIDHSTNNENIMKLAYPWANEYKVCHYAYTVIFKIVA